MPADTALPATASAGSGVVELGGAMPGAAVLAALDRGQSPKITHLRDALPYLMGLSYSRSMKKGP